MKVVRIGVLLGPLCLFLVWWAWRQSRDHVPPLQAFEDALQAVETGDWATVRLAANQLDAQPEFSQHARLLEAATQLRSGRPESALELLNGIPPEGELRFHLLRFTGEAFYATGRPGDAEVLFRVVATEFPDEPAGHRWLGVVYFDLGAMNQALRALDRLAELAPDDDQPHWLRGVIYSDFERFPEAVSAYRAALERDPPPERRARILSGLIVSLVESHEYATAIELFQENKSVRDGEALAALVEAYRGLGGTEESQRLMQQAAESAPQARDVRYWQAMFALEDGRTQEAVPYLGAILSDDPHDTEARYQLAMTYRQLGRTEEYSAAMARKEESEALIRRLHELNLEAIASPRDPVVRDECADLCETLGRPRLAQMWRRAAAACRAGTDAQAPATGFSSSDPGAKP